MIAIEELPNVWVAGREWDFSNVPKFVKHQMLLLVQKWDTNFNDRTKVPAFAAHKARLLAEKYAKPHL